MLRKKKCRQSDGSNVVSGVFEEPAACDRLKEVTDRYDPEWLDSRDFPVGVRALRGNDEWVAVQDFWDQVRDCAESDWEVFPRDVRDFLSENDWVTAACTCKRVLLSVYDDQDLSEAIGVPKGIKWEIAQDQSFELLCHAVR